MSEKEESPKENNMKDFYSIDPNKQINFINNSLFEIDTIEDKYDKANSTGSDTFNEKYSNIEYAKTLKISLKDSINQNDLLTEELMKVINENKILREELEEKKKAIEELSQYYNYCIENHLNSNCGKFEETMGTIEGGNYTSSGWTTEEMAIFQNYSSIWEFNCKGNFVSNSAILISLIFIIFLI
mgnify:CR=1 FL=1